jgi:hypothetical protein
MIRAILILALFCSAFRAYAQEDHEVNEASWEDQLNDNPNKSIDPYQWAENLPILGDSKKALNFCSVEELLALPYLDVFSVNNIRQHIENTGSILSEKELHTIKGLDSTIVEKLLNDFNLKARKTKEEISWSSIINYSRQQIILRAITNFEKWWVFRLARRLFNSLQNSLSSYFTSRFYLAKRCRRSLAK